MGPANRGSLTWFLDGPVEDSPFVLSPQFPDCVTLLSDALYLRLKAVFLRPDFLRGTTIAVKIGQAVARGQVRTRPLILSLSSHGIASTI